MLRLPAELDQDIVSRLSWAAIKALARASKAARDAARRGVVSLEWGHWTAPLPAADLRQAFPSARRLVLKAALGYSGYIELEAFLAVNAAVLSQLQHLQLDGEAREAVAAMGTIGAQCPRLQCLEVLQALALPEHLQPLAALTQLTRLQVRLGSHQQLSYSALTSAISSITGLRELSAWGFVSGISSELRGTTALRRLSRLEFVGAEFCEQLQQDFGCLAAIPSLRALHLHECSSMWQPSSLSHLTMLEELALLGCMLAYTPFQLPISALAALTRLRSLDLDSRKRPQDLDQQALQELRPMLAGLGRLSLGGRIRGVGDLQLLGCIGCTQLEFLGFEGCAEPAAGAGPPLPGVSSLRLTSRVPQPLDPLVLRQAGLTSLGLLHCTDASCEHLPRAFPQLRVLQLGWRGVVGGAAELSAAGLAHLGALQHLQQLHLVHPQLKPSQLQQLSAISSLRRLLIQVKEPESIGDAMPLSEQPASALEAALAGLVGAASRRLRQVLFLASAASCWIGQGRREELQVACDRVVAGSGRQDLVAEVKRWDEDEAWEWMLGQQAAAP
jgi:hypothetical protein